jgi:hypothetical protein
VHRAVPELGLAIIPVLFIGLSSHTCAENSFLCAGATSNAVAPQPQRYRIEFAGSLDDSLDVLKESSGKVAAAVDINVVCFGLRYSISWLALLYQELFKNVSDGMHNNISCFPSSDCCQPERPVF